jgi:hypothetical protein
MAITINGDGAVTVSGAAATQGRVLLAEQTGNGTNTVTLQAPASLASDLALTLPSADGTNGQVLQTNGSGALSFAGVSLTTGVAGILPVANGGTNNAFFTVSGPASTAKTYTFPNENMSVGYRNIPISGAAKTSSYTLDVGDVGKCIEVGSGGSIIIPNSVFSAGDVVSIFNNTSGSVTITCTISTAYKGGTDSDQATVTLQTRGVATVLFIGGTVCVINGNLA